MRAGEGGLTLIEVTLSMVVLAVGVLGAAGMQLRALQASEQARGHSQAAWLAQGWLERVRAGTGVGPIDQSGWQAELKRTLGGAAEGSVRRDAGRVQVEVRWGRVQKDDPLVVSLQGRVER
nr:type IV pilus modification protein PilV [uncultured Pseudomonas sp.]